MIQFDYRIVFPMGWFNHQPVFVSKDWCPTQIISATENTTDLVPSYVGIAINHEIRIRVKQPGFNGRYFDVPGS